jgi:hypothetical protein
VSAHSKSNADSVADTDANGDGNLNTQDNRHA